jgi:hypothetical protein
MWNENSEDEGRPSFFEEAFNDEAWTIRNASINTGMPLSKCGKYLLSNPRLENHDTDTIKQQSADNSSEYQWLDADYETFDDAFETTNTNASNRFIPSLQDPSEASLAYPWNCFPEGFCQDFPNFDDSGLVSGSLLDLHNASTAEARYEEGKFFVTPSMLQRVPEPEPEPEPPRNAHRASPQRRTRQTPVVPYPTPPTSGSSSSEETPQVKRGHQVGWNVQTGSPTLAGDFPPVVVHAGDKQLYYCTHPPCVDDPDGKPKFWTTRNGYKYHLIWQCLQNPNSKASLKLAKGITTGGRTRSPFSKTCACGKSFRSEAGWKKHRLSNESTKEGRCLQKVKSPRSSTSGKLRRQPIMGESTQGDETGGGDLQVATDLGQQLDVPEANHSTCTVLGSENESPKFEHESPEFEHEFLESELEYYLNYGYLADEEPELPKE